MGYFDYGSYFPPKEHRLRIDRYKLNRKVFKGQHFEVFQDYNGSKRHQDLLYVSVNLAGIICKKSADFLFGEAVQVKAGNGNSSKEQEAFDRMIKDNNFNILTYENALGNAYRGDSFIKIRYGQEYGGMLSTEVDPSRVIFENVNGEFVFPVTSAFDANKIICYHIAIPVMRVVQNVEEWTLFVESHYPGRIEYSSYSIVPSLVTSTEIVDYKVQGENVADRHTVMTGVPVPLIVHIPNYCTDDTWEGLDDLTEHMGIFDEINNRLTQIADILDKHADPAMAIPSGLLGEDSDGNPVFNVSRDKVFEVFGKDDRPPAYITWDGQLQHCFAELDRLVDLLLTTAEIPAVALGRGADSGGTSGTSGLAIKFRMNSLLSKINRKRQYYNKGILQVLKIAQLLEAAVKIADYKYTVPQLVFNDGLPKDDSEDATVMNIRTGGMKTLSQKTAVMRMENMTEEQADVELEQIKKETEENMPEPLADPNEMFNKTEDTSKHAEEAKPKKDPKKTGAKKG